MLVVGIWKNLYVFFIYLEMFINMIIYIFYLFYIDLLRLNLFIVINIYSKMIFLVFCMGVRVVFVY